MVKKKKEGKVKAIKSEVKENVQGNNNEGKQTGTQINGLEHKEEINIQLEQNEERRIQKKKRENQDGGVGRHIAPPRTTRTDRESNGKGVGHQGNKK